MLADYTKYFKLSTTKQQPEWIFSPVLQNLQAVEGDLVLQNNPNLVSLAGAAQTLTSVKGQVSSNPRCDSAVFHFCA